LQRRLSDNIQNFELRSKFYIIMYMQKKVVVIGGGTGTMAVLSGLKKYPDLDLHVIVSMTDDGGSNQIVRDEFGLLPLSDLRKSLIALAETEDQLLRQLFVYRFDKGNGISGHTLGNLMMIALTDITGSELLAIEACKKLFKVKGNVIPVTMEQTKLVAEYNDGARVEGEHLIDEPEGDCLRKIRSLTLSENVPAQSEALDAIRTADYIVAGPGDLYTSTLANIIIDGIAEQIQKSPAKFVFINNLMTKKGQTQGMTATQLIDEMSKYSGRVPDVVLQHAGEFHEEILKRYQERGEHPIHDDIAPNPPYLLVRAHLTHNALQKIDSGDTLVRSLIRHDADKLSHALYSVFQS
jgi:uncharacterized cofD-like protein